MELEAFTLLDIPFFLVVYGAVLIFIRPPKNVLLASLLGGLAMGAINALVDLLAYYAHWWHYTVHGLILHLPVPFYASPVLFGSIALLLIWRFWRGRGHWFALTLLIGVPLFRAAMDMLGSLAAQSIYNANYDSWLAAPLDLVMWLAMFYAGYWLFQRLTAETPYVALTSEAQQ